MEIAVQGDLFFPWSPAITILGIYPTEESTDVYTTICTRGSQQLCS